MADSFQLEIVTPEKLVVKDRAEEMQIPGKNGYLGILPGHEHGKKSPSRQPADYKCCVAGHEAALLRSTATSHPVSQIGNVIPLGVPLVIELISLSPSIAVTPPNPGSRNAPLRV